MTVLLFDKEKETYTSIENVRVFTREATQIGNSNRYKYIWFFLINDGTFENRPCKRYELYKVYTI